MLLYLAAVCSCKNNIPDDHPAYFDSIFYKVDTTVYEHKLQALAFLDSAYKVFPNPGTGDKAEYFYRKRYYYFFVKNDYEKAMKYEDSMMQLVEGDVTNERHAELYARTLFLKGHSNFRLKRYSEASGFYYQAKRVMKEQVKYPCRLSEYGSSMANLFYAQGKYLLAAQYYSQQYFEMQQCPADDRETWMSRQGCLNNIGLCYYKANMLDSAALYCTKALDVIDITDRKFPGYNYSITIAKAVVYANQAQILTKNGQFEAATVLFKKSIAGTTSGDAMYTQNTMLQFAQMYFDNHENDSANLIMQQLQRSLDTLSNGAVLTLLYKLKVDYYTQQKQIGPAQEILKKYIHIKDSVEAKDKAFSAVDVSNDFESREQKAINEALIKDNRVKTFYLLVSGVIFLMIIAIILLVVYNFKRTSNHAKKLEILNEEINQKNEELQKTLNSLKQSHNENTRITRVVAHDLKNPISAVRNLVYSLLKKENAGSFKDVLETIENACLNSISLIKDLLNEKPKSADNRKELVNLGILVEQCIDLFQSQAIEKNQLLKLNAEHFVLRLNRQKIWRVISNIINNAIKFSPENAEINITLQKNNNLVLLAVQDNGIGIPPELKDKIFLPNLEAIRTGTSGEKSHGLGLSISQKIMEEHEGRIWFESEAGRGSSFFVELPYLQQ